MKTAIIYSSKHGCTEKCSQTLANELSTNTSVINLDITDSIQFENYDTIILGGSIHAGMLNRSMKKFISKNLKEISEKKVGLFLCCMEEGEKAQEQFNNAFPEEIRNMAKVKGLFGGEFNFDRMNFIEKAIIKKIANIENNLSKINYKNISQFANEINQ